MGLIKISGSYLPDQVAGAIAGYARYGEDAVIRTIGARAGYVALKSLIKANVYLEGDGIRVAVTSRFVPIEIEDVERTAIEMPILIWPAEPEADGEELEAESAQVVRVSNRTLPKGAAGAIAGYIRQGRHPVVQAIGEDAAYVALKAVILAQKFLTEEGIAIATVPNYHELDLDGRERTAIRLPVMVTEAGAPPPNLL